MHFASGSFDAASAFYVFNHIPRDAIGPLLRRLAEWLRPGGLLVASFGAQETLGHVEPDWLGAPAYFSGYAPGATLRLVREAGFVLDESVEASADEDGRPITFLLVVARTGGNAG